MAALLMCVVAVAAALLLSACSAKKNTAGNRRYQEFITRYNIYYNGNTHFVETLEEMETKYEDDYSRLLFMHPVEAKADKNAPQPSGNFDRSIEKAQKAIQLRSIKKKPAKKAGKSKDPAYKEWMKRDEYNPFLHNAWMMLGRGQFYNGDFLGAASTFFYTSRHFSWLPATVSEAKLMQALSYIALGWQFEAEMILTRIKVDDLTNNRLRRLYNFAYADFYVHAGQYEEALPFMVEAVKGAKKEQKTRLNFLLGQLYQRLGQNENAYKAFAAAGSSSSTSYRTKFNARIKQSEVYSGADIEPEVKALRRMTRYDRNKEYLDQIYYAIGNLYLSRGDTLRAIENYETANEKSTRNGIDKAINQLRLGELYFMRGNYEKAQPSYSEAVPQLPESYPGYALIKRRSDVLDELAVYSQNVNLQDSLLRLAAMSPEERLKVIDKIIKELKEKEKKEQEDAAREEYLANQAAQGGGLQDHNSQSFTINSDNSWYFYNTATKNAGKTDFQKRWGSRKLEDDWRRRNKASFNTDDFDAAAAADGTAAGQDSGEEVPAEEGEEPAEEKDSGEPDKSADPHYPEYYLAQIPSTETEIANSHEVIQEGLYNMGVILKDKLDDFGSAATEFGRLLSDYPDNIYRLDTYYNLYLMYMRMGDTARAEQYRQLILSDFADSKYGVALRDPDYIGTLRSMDSRMQELYENTYEAYLDNRNAEVHRAYEYVNEKYPLSKILPKFMFLHALAYVTEKDSKSFNEVLRELLDRYPDTDITPVASAWLKGMAQGRELQAGTGTNMRGMIWDLRLTNDSTTMAADSTAAQFELNPDARQKLVFTFDTDRVPTNELLFDIARHNFRSFVVKDFDLEQMNFGRLGMVIVSGFENQAELDHYRRVMADSEDFSLRPGVRPIAISEANFSILIEQGRSFEEYFNYLEQQNYVDAQADLLTPEEVEELPEEEPEAPEAPEEPEAPAEAEAPAEEVSADSTAVAVPDSTAVGQVGPVGQVGEPDSTAVGQVAVPDSTAVGQVGEPSAPAEQPKQQAPKQPAKPAAPVTKPQPVPMLPGSEGDDDPLLDDF